MTHLCLGSEFFSRLFEFVESDEYCNTVHFSGGAPENSDVSKTLLTRMLEEHGFVVVKFSECPKYGDVLDWLKERFGEPIPDSSIHSSEYSKIEAVKHSKYFANSSRSQPLHCDEAHTATPPDIVTLYCENQASRGGVTTLADLTQYWLSHSVSDDSNPIFEENGLTLYGAQGELRRALCSKGADGRVRCAFPSILRKIEGRKEVLDAYKSMILWMHRKENQVRLRLERGDLLILNNYRIVHGRTKFDLDENRRLFRSCFSAPPVGKSAS